MAWNDGRASHSEIYTDQQVRAILGRLGIAVDNETVHDLLVLCPFHSNRDTPSLSISKTTGQWVCFNPSCWERGSMIDFIQRVGGYNPLEAMRLATNCSSGGEQDYGARILESVQHKPDIVPFPQDVIERLALDFWDSPGHAYMTLRGFNDDTLAYFNVGYSHKQAMVSVPVYSADGIPVGIVGRSVVEKRFKNSVGLPVTTTLFNIHNARQHSAAIVTESTFDAMRVHQAGYPGAVATLGGNFGPEKASLLARNFSNVIIMTDNDEKKFHHPCARCKDGCRGHKPGLELGLKISESFPRAVMWASYSDTEIYPHGAKDAGDMSDSEIAECIERAVSDIEFRTLRVV